MKQLFMKKNPMSSANLVTEDVPVPNCSTNSVLLSNRYSLISAGTETASVKRNMKDMVVKVMSDPELRESLKDMIFKDGILKTADRVNFETTKWTPMGYTGAGVAIETGTGIDGIGKGEKVAYGGQGHAEYIKAAKNLCVKIPDGVSEREASFVAVGSIALQAVRRAKVQVGEVVAVLGLGLVGQLVSQMLQAGGARVLGSDILGKRLELAEQLGAEKAYMADDMLPDNILRYTNGIGVDHVLICAGGSGDIIIQQAIAMARDRARITVVGMINFNMPFEAFYSKELDLVSSRSYGPGRYDSQYEEHGIEYPIGYVRWTEKQNMEEFLRLIQVKKVDVESLITHDFPLSRATDAYRVLMENPDECMAIVLEYEQKDINLDRCISIKRKSNKLPSKKTSANVAVAGCGDFARQFHLPNIKADNNLFFKTLVTSSGQSAKEMAVRYGAENCTTDYQSVLDDPDIDAVFIFTRDNTHAAMTSSALSSGKHVFCEKPLATSFEECTKIARISQETDRLCMVGYNRRFAPLIQPVKQILQSCNGPKAVQYRINAGSMPNDNWVYDSKFANGRVVGEVCHFIDLVSWLISEEPVSVTAHCIGDAPSLVKMEDVFAVFEFSGGSVATILYTAIGSSSFSKERIEIFSDGTSIAMDNFQSLTIRGKQRVDSKNRRGDKGHSEELKHFSSAILGKVTPQVTYLDGLLGTICSLKIWESVNTGKKQSININSYL